MAPKMNPKPRQNTPKMMSPNMPYVHNDQTKQNPRKTLLWPLFDRTHIQKAQKSDLTALKPTNIFGWPPKDFVKKKMQKIQENAIRNVHLSDAASQKGLRQSSIQRRWGLGRGM